LPDTAIAATQVLQDAGCEVLVPQPHFCCGRPLYDYGFLEMAKGYLQRILDGLGPEIDRGTPVVVLEPSCCAVFRDELNGLFPDSARAHKLQEQTFTLSEFLQKQKFTPPTLRKKAIVHGHCHHKAIMRTEHEEQLYRDMHLDWKMLDSGCCGMAGSFGFEQDKYQISVDIGERVLLPAVRRAEESTILIADGFSCREQIAQLTEREALHTAEVLALAMHNPETVESGPPERATADRRKRAMHNSMLKAGIAAGAAVVGLGLLAWTRKK